MSKIPQHLLYRVKDACLRRLANRVWRRLPAHDRAVLRSLLMRIYDGEEMPEDVLGQAGGIAPNDLVNGCPAQVAEDLAHRVSLTRAKDIESDAACMFVIAHEFAHIVLRHPEMGAVIGVQGLESVYIEADRKAHREWREDHADLLVWVWGFQDELRAFLDAYPEARCPRWYVELEVEDTGEQG